MAAGMNRNVLFKANPILLFHNFEASPRSGVGAVAPAPQGLSAKGDKTRMQSQAPGEPLPLSSSNGARLTMNNCLNAPPGDAAGQSDLPA